MKTSMTGDAMARQVLNYLSEANKTMQRMAQDPDYEDAAHYIEMLTTSMEQQIRSGKPLTFKPKDLGL